MSHLSGTAAGPRVAVVLAGCGFLDGAEINEAVISLLALSRAGARVRCFAPDKPQMHVVDHLAGAPVDGATRNVLVESARIVRGAIEPLSALSADDFDALFLPGGFGVAKNLSTFATKGTDGTVEPDLVAVLQAFRAADKPIGAVCISPAVVVLALHEGEVTIGSDAGTAAAIEALGGTHHACPVTEASVDRARKLATAPAFMEDAQLWQVADGIEQAVAATLSMVSA
ncbi:MAG: isoprenoid biosynthesis glyoxalase ElbB [Alphaproteobacteria bacterium]|nr:isoprenoid biosynthesis glyoxalase ElbB [Alphaproteobacteria bacterium]